MINKSANRLLFLEFVLSNFRNKTIRNYDINYYYCCAYNNITILCSFSLAKHTHTRKHTCISQYNESKSKYIPSIPTTNC